MSRPDLCVLTSLRFFAAAVVLLFHCKPPWPEWMPTVVRGWTDSGYEAVTFFFVLSGFVLYYANAPATAAAPADVDPRRFLRARIARIAPAYYFALLVALPAFTYAIFVSHMTPREQFGISLVLVPLLLQAWVPLVATAWNVPAWSLSVEWFFYLSFPLLIRLVQRFALRNAAIGAAALLVLSEALRASVARSHPGELALVQFFPLFHLASFVAGIALGRIFVFGPRLPPRSAAILFAAAAVGAALVLGYRDRLPDWTRSNLALAPLFGGAIFAAAGLRGALARVLSRPGLILLGESSYALYILHVPAIFWLQRIAKHAAGGLDPSPWLPLAMAPAVIGLSVLVHLWFERPMRARILARPLTIGVAALPGRPSSNPPRR